MPTHSESMRNVHPPLQTEATEEARKERMTWIALGVFGFVTGCVLFWAFAYAAGDVGA